jgi:mRNA-degrading endonuclease HigB of HigAB toxin-antitoxin module
MAGGTFYIVSKRPPSLFPEIRRMVSISMHALATPENIAAREPTVEEMDFLTPEQAKRMWGADVDQGQRNRVWSIEGNTVRILPE